MAPEETKTMTPEQVEVEHEKAQKVFFPKRNFSIIEVENGFTVTKNSVPYQHFIASTIEEVFAIILRIINEPGESKTNNQG